MRNRGRVYHTHWMIEALHPAAAIVGGGLVRRPLEEIILCIKG